MRSNRWSANRRYAETTPPSRSSRSYFRTTCGRHYPDGTVGCCRCLARRHRPSPKLSRVGFCNIPFRGLLSVHSRFGLHVRSITQGDLSQSTSTNSLPPSSLWLLPAERPIGWAGFAPAGDRRLSRHTGFMGLAWSGETRPAASMPDLTRKANVRDTAALIVRPQWGSSLLGNPMRNERLCFWRAQNTDLIGSCGLTLSCFGVRHRRALG